MYLKIVVCFALYASPAFAKGVSNTADHISLRRSVGKDLFGIWNHITTGWSNLATLVTTAQDIFSILNNSSDPNNENEIVPPDTFLNITELASKYGYLIEEHEVVTEDGYILTVHRLKGNNVKSHDDKVIFLMHGLVDSSDSWLLQGPGKALGYILADEGFDVWMGNARGNKHALRHTERDPKESDFWQFTWDEIGLYDLPASIDYVLNITENKSLYYVGYSQGSTSFYVMSSMKPEYNEKVKMMFSLAPVAWMSNVKSPLVKIFSPAYKILAYLLSNFNTKSSSTDFFNKLAAVFCSYLPSGCINILYMIEGYELKNINSTLIPVILGHMPTGASTLQFIHYGQLVNSGRFAPFDFGAERNLMAYGQVSPPDYNLTKITVPIDIFYSDNDWLSDKADVDMLKEKLPNVVGYNLISGFNHLDYSYASKAKEEVYNEIILKIYESEDKINLAMRDYE